MLNNCDDSVLLLHRQTVMAHKRPYSLLQRARRRLQMLNDCDDGVLLVRRGAVMTQMRPYTRSTTRARYEYATPRPKYGSPHQP